MDKLLFGISGLPMGDGKRRFHYATAIPYLRSIGLDAMELLFVRNVNVTDHNKDAILEAKKAEDFYLSAHGSYYVNLNAADDTKQTQSINRIINGVKGLARVRGRSLVFHPGYYGNSSKEAAYSAIKSNLLKLPDCGIAYRLETTGKGSQFGTLEELVSLCSELPRCKLCIDFAHIHARTNGGLKNYEDFAALLQYVSDHLGRSALEDLHIHMAGIEYGPKGEKQHLPLLESDFNFTACLRAFKDYQVRGCVIAEGPLLEKDALLLKNTYEAL